MFHPISADTLLWVMLAIGDFNCPIYLGIQAHLYTGLINLGPIDNEAFSGAGMP